jgi:hypothetical protein
MEDKDPAIYRFSGFRLDAALSLVGFAITLLFVGGTLFSRRHPVEQEA